MRDSKLGDKKKNLACKKIFNFSQAGGFNLHLYLNYIIGSFVKNGKKYKIIKKFFSLELLLRQHYKSGLLKVLYFCFQLSKILLNFKLWNLGRKQIQIAFLPRSFFREEGRLAARFLVANIKFRTERTLLLKLFAEMGDILQSRGGSNLTDQKKKLYLTLVNNKHYLRFLRISRPPKFVYKRKVK